MYVVNNGYVVAEYYETTLTAVYLWGANLIKSGIGSTTSYYLYNAHGDVVQLTDEDGAVVKNYLYDAFGVEDEPDVYDTNPFRYCGEYWDKESGTYYLRARYYAPSIGRFTQQDTHWNPANMIYGDDPAKINERTDELGLITYTMVPQITAVAQSGNLYVYCVGNPLRYLDSSGCQAVVMKPDAVPGGVIYTGFPLEGLWGGLLGLGGIIQALFHLGDEKTAIIDIADGAGKAETEAGDKKSEGDAKDAEDEKRITIPNSKSVEGHIFREKEGHIADTPENRRLLEDTANDKNNYVGTDQNGKDWYGKELPDGRQIWVSVRNGQIIDGGINASPHSFDPRSGFSNPTRGW